MPVGTDYFASDSEREFLAAERAHLRERWEREGRGEVEPRRLVGLALSGGGVRSASFSIGVMQALAETPADGMRFHTPPAERRLIDTLHFLSTVSGGGFAGTSLTWYQHYSERRRRGAKRRALPVSGFDHAAPFPFSRCGSDVSMLASIRYGASYLEPGAGFNKFTGLAMAGRTVASTLAIYVLLLIGLLGLIYPFLSERWIAPDWSPEARRALPDWVTADLNLATVAAAVLLLLLGAAFLLHAMATGLFPRLGGIRSRRWIEYWGGWLIRGIAGFAILAAMGYLPDDLFTRLFSTVTSGTTTSLIAAAGTIGAFATRFLTEFGGKSDRRIWPILVVWISGLILIVGTLLLARTIVLTIKTWDIAATGPLTYHYQPPYFLWIGVILAFALAVGLTSNVNYINLHRLYRDRLMQAFLTPPWAGSLSFEMGGTDRSMLAVDKLAIDVLAERTSSIPYQIINCNVVLVNAAGRKYRARGGDSFILTELYWGSSATGWMSWACLRESAQGTFSIAKRRLLKPISLASAMAASGAALNPRTGADGRGPTRSGMVSFILALLGIRLGYWQPNPAVVQSSWSGFTTPDFIRPGLWDGILAKGHREDSNWVELTDGGHFDNIGLYELVRRRVKTIIIADGTADPEFSMESFSNAYERARNDFGIVMKISGFVADFNDMMPGSARPNSPIKQRYNLAERGFAIGKIWYPGDPEPGYVFYINTVLTENLPANLYSYRAAHPDFPDEPTSDQFFDAQQFDAYCELGYELTMQMIAFARGYKPLAAALGIAAQRKPKKAKAKVSDPLEAYDFYDDPPYKKPEELIAEEVREVGKKISGLAGKSAMKRLIERFS